MAKVQHQGGAVAEVNDDLLEALLVSGEWAVVGSEKPAETPVRRPRKAAAVKDTDNEG